MAEAISVLALYHFVAIERREELQALLRELCEREQIKGTLLVASEGLNGTVAGSRSSLENLLEALRRYPGLEKIEGKWSSASEPPFLRMKVRLKKEIVTMGVPECDPNKVVGTYVEGEEWNRLLDDPDVILIDTRNDYEVRVGRFEGAVDPKMESFREFPKYVADNLDPKKNKKVAMYCTGGIRCEKASSYMLDQGFEEVYHLKGGILKYLEDMKEEQSKWEGECFVFDHRVSLKHGLDEGTHRMCFGCQQPLSAEDMKSDQYEEGVCCPYCFSEIDEAKKSRLRERIKQSELAEMRGESHVGQDSASYKKTALKKQRAGSVSHAE